MTLICGIWHSGNKFDLQSGLAAMMQSIAKYSEDENRVWHAEEIALGQITIQVNTESIYESLPFHHSESNVTIAGDIRLDNRKELFAKLDIALHLQSQISDSTLILFSYLKWGQYCAEHLLGDFAFALWDGNQKKLFCCSDHFSVKGLYYFFDGHKFIFASVPDAILATKEVEPCINSNKLSALLFPEAKHFFWKESWYEHIYPLPAATIMTIDETGIRKRRYWKPEIKQALSFKNESEYAEAFQEVLFTAVNDRLRSNFPVTALLSGGLDSSSVVAVAAKILEKQNRELQVFSAVLPNENDLVLQDERYFIDLFKSFPNVTINYITAPGKSFISDIDDLLNNSCEPGLISRHYLNTAFTKKARELGSRVILVGQGGELGPTSYANGIYAELFSQFRWKRLWRELTSRKIVTGELLADNLRSHVIKPLLPVIIKHLLEGKKTGLQPAEAHYLHPDLAVALTGKLKAIEKELSRLLPSLTSANHRHNQLRWIQNFQNKARGAGALEEIESRSPLIDVRLLEFCLAAPAEYKTRNGYQRYLVRAGLNKILPPEIQWRNSKAPFSPDYHRRYNQHLPDAKYYLEAIQPDDPVRKVVDIDQLKAWLTIPVADDEHNTFAERVSRDYVPQGIYLIQFLRRFKEFQN